METVKVKAFAKINLSLDIKGKREDGYHLLEMVMQSVDLYDLITLSKKDSGGISISCSVPYIPTDEKNIAYKCAKAFFDATGIENPGIHIDILKNIPVQAGLAGGSADGAGVLYCLNRLFSAGLSPDKLCQIGAKCGADIPFCLKGGTVLARGIGEELIPLPPVPPQALFLIAKPERGVKTKEAFSMFDKASSLPAPPDTEGLLRAIEKGDLSLVGRHMGNVLEDICAPVSSKSLIRHMKNRGALGSIMTGSGSAVFGLFEDKKVAASCLHSTRASFKQLCRPVSFGVEEISV